MVQKLEVKKMRSKVTSVLLDCFDVDQHCCDDGPFRPRRRRGRRWRRSEQKSSEGLRRLPTLSGHAASAGLIFIPLFNLFIADRSPNLHSEKPLKIPPLEIAMVTDGSSREKRASSVWKHSGHVQTCRQEQQRSQRSRQLPGPHLAHSSSTVGNPKEEAA